MPTNASGLGISDKLWQLLARCWNADHNKRPQIDEVLRHLCQESARGLIFPPSRPSQAPSWEEFPGPGTHEHGTSYELELVCLRAHLSLAHMFPTSNAPTPTERIPGIALAPIKFSHFFIFPEHPTFQARASTVSTCTFGDASLAILLGSLNTGQPYDMVGESDEAENQPSQELINDLDKGGRAQHSNQGQG